METAGILPQKSTNLIISTFEGLFRGSKIALTKELIRFDKKRLRRHSKTNFSENPNDTSPFLYLFSLIILFDLIVLSFLLSKFHHFFQYN